MTMINVKEYVAQFLDGYARSIAAEGVRADVLKFIAEWQASIGDGNSIYKMVSVYVGDYCYYFASMLQQAFNRGKIVLAAPTAHIIWEDDNGVGYDANGTFTDYQFAIDIENIPDVDRFKQGASTPVGLDDDELKELLVKYAPDEYALQAAYSQLGWDDVDDDTKTFDSILLDSIQRIGYGGNVVADVKMLLPDALKVDTVDVDVLDRAVTYALKRLATK